MAHRCYFSGSEGLNKDTLDPLADTAPNYTSL
jgi:hypothetical protein